MGEVSWCDPNPSDRSAPDRWPAQCGIRRASQPAPEHRAHQARRTENRARSTEHRAPRLPRVPNNGNKARTQTRPCGWGREAIAETSSRVGSSRDPESRRRVETPPSPRDRERAAPTWITNNPRSSDVESPRHATSDGDWVLVYLCFLLGATDRPTDDRQLRICVHATDRQTRLAAPPIYFTFCCC